MKIIRIVKKDENNVVVYLDNDEKLYLTYEVMLKNGLRKDKEIPDGHFDFLIRENQKHHIKNKAFSYIARRHHSVFEIRTKLRKKKYDDNLIDEIINDLLANNYLNDKEFAEIFIEENIRLKLWGRNKLKAELIKRGIKSQIIDEVINKKFSDKNYVDNAFELAERKYNILKKRNLENPNLKQKLFSFLSSRGYDYQTSKDALEKILGRDEEEFD